MSRLRLENLTIQEIKAERKQIESNKSITVPQDSNFGLLIIAKAKSQAYHA